MVHALFSSLVYLFYQSCTKDKKKKNQEISPNGFKENGYTSKGDHSHMNVFASFLKMGLLLNRIPTYSQKGYMY